MKMKGLNFRSFEKILKDNNFKKDRQMGDHVIFKNDNGSHVSVPNRGGKELSRPLVLRLIKENNLKI